MVKKSFSKLKMSNTRKILPSYSTEPSVSIGGSSEQVAGSIMSLSVWSLYCICLWALGLPPTRQRHALYFFLSDSTPVPDDLIGLDRSKERSANNINGAPVVHDYCDVRRSLLHLVPQFKSARDHLG